LRDRLTTGGLESEVLHELSPNSQPDLKLVIRDRVPRSPNVSPFFPDRVLLFAAELLLFQASHSCTLKQVAILGSASSLACRQTALGRQAVDVALDVEEGIDAVDGLDAIGELGAASTLAPVGQLLPDKSL
jgi:hypothetical protein